MLLRRRPARPCVRHALPLPRSAASILHRHDHGDLAAFSLLDNIDGSRMFNWNWTGLREYTCIDEVRHWTNHDYNRSACSLEPCDIWKEWVGLWPHEKNGWYHQIRARLRALARSWNGGHLDSACNPSNRRWRRCTPRCTLSRFAEGRKYRLACAHQCAFQWNPRPIFQGNLRLLTTAPCVPKTSSVSPGSCADRRAIFCAACHWRKNLSLSAAPELSNISLSSLLSV